jgi:hypothetical protein
MIDQTNANVERKFSEENLTDQKKYGGTKKSTALPKAKKGGDKKWIQKAINPAHKGYCTPMTKPTCTPKRKALAITLKKMAKNR